MVLEFGVLFMNSLLTDPLPRDVTGRIIPFQIIINLHTVFISIAVRRLTFGLIPVPAEVDTQMFIKHSHSLRTITVAELDIFSWCDKRGGMRFQIWGQRLLQPEIFDFQN